MISDGKERAFPSLSFICDQAIGKLHFQSEQWNALDAKNSIVLAVYGIVLAIMIGMDTSSLSVTEKAISLICLGITTFGMSCSLLSIIPRNIDMPPEISKLSEKYLQHDEYDTKNSLLSTIENTIKKNDKIIEKKMKYLSLSIKFCLPISLSISVIWVFLKIINGG